MPPVRGTPEALWTACNTQAKGPVANLGDAVALLRLAGLRSITQEALLRGGACRSDLRLGARRQRTLDLVELAVEVAIEVSLGVTQPIRLEAVL